MKPTQLWLVETDSSDSFIYAATKTVFCFAVRIKLRCPDIASTVIAFMMFIFVVIEQQGMSDLIFILDSKAKQKTGEIII